MITSTIVSHRDRLSFYPSITSSYISLEKTIYYYTEQFLIDYKRSHWVFVRLSNGGKFSYPKMNDPVVFNNKYNDVFESLSIEAIGICIWIIALGTIAMSEFKDGDLAEMNNISEYQILLMNYANEHEEWDKIIRVLKSNTIITCSRRT